MRRLQPEESSRRDCGVRAFKRRKAVSGESNTAETLDEPSYPTSVTNLKESLFTCRLRLLFQGFALLNIINITETLWLLFCFPAPPPRLFDLFTHLCGSGKRGGS